jgi:copper(I)-binding protein
VPDLRITRRRAGIALALLVATAAGARAADPTPGPVTVTNAWANPASAGGSVAVYGTIANAADDPDRLIGAISPSAASGELHDAKSAAPVPAIAIPAHGSVTLALGGDYVSYAGLKSDLVAGGLFFARLHFERAGWLVTIVHVRGTGSAPGISSPSGAVPVPAYSSVPVIPVPVIQH